MERVKILWDDSFISAHWEEYRNWLSLCKAYNKAHGTDISYNTFKSHCYRMGLNFHYTPEQEAWIRDYYPSHGYLATATEFNKRFETNRTPGAIKLKCKHMGLKVEFHRRQARAFENTGNYVHPVGAIVIKQHGEPYVKTENGYRQLKRVVYGDVPRGKVLIHLNGDQSDCSKENLHPVKRSILARMTINSFWSENKTVTKTGVMCCELEEALKKKHGRRKEKTNGYSKSMQVLRSGGCVSEETSSVIHG